jgi:hypothetical protein
MPQTTVNFSEQKDESTETPVDIQAKPEDDTRARPWEEALANDKEENGHQQEDVADMWIAAQGTVAA